MSHFEQPELDSAASGYIFEEGIVLDEYSVSLFVVDPDKGKPNVQLVLICPFEGKSLVCVPHSSWHRTLSKRVLPRAALTRAQLLEVAAARHDELLVPLPNTYIKVWVGFLKPEFMDNVHTHLTEMDYDNGFDLDPDGVQLLPYASGLVEAAQDHFAFFSAEDGQHQQHIDGEPATEEEMQEALEDDAGLDPAEKRLVRMEKAIKSLVASVGQLATKKVEDASKTQASAAAKPAASQRATGLPLGQASSSKQQVKTPKKGNPVQFPSLDAGVVQAALQAGVPVSNLQEMEKLISQNTKAKKMTDIAKPLRFDPLSEDELVGEDAKHGLIRDDQEFGLETGQGDVMQQTMLRLASIMEILTEDKKKKASRSPLDQALDQVATGSSDTSVSAGGRKSELCALRFRRTRRLSTRPSRS